MPFAAQVFVILLVAGLMLVGAEIFVPGGFLGFLGGLALLGAVATSFAAFGPAAGAYAAVGIVFLLALVIALWIRIFPRSPFGRRMTVSGDLRDSKGTQNGLADLVGQEGEALSDLRPGGFALIGGRRIDVITQGEMIAKGDSLRVSSVSGNRVIVTSTAPH